MANAWEAFNDAYIRKLKRPEYWGFNPDQASGSSMLFRSEETNPWAGRDRSNAQFGQLGASSGVKAQIPSISVNQPSGSPVQNIMPQGWNLPLMPSPQKDTFATLMSPVAPVVGQWAGKKIYDWLKPEGFAALSPEMKGLAESFVKGGAPDAYSDLASRFGKEASTLTESGLGGYEKLAEGMTEKAGETTGSLMAGFDPATAAAAAAPMLARMFGLRGTGADVLGAATSTGVAAAQGFMNPISDIGALYSLYKMFRGFF